jgi:hypothetical protein
VSPSPSLSVIDWRVSFTVGRVVQRIPNP